MKHTATAVWNGTGKEGKGHLSSTSTVLENTPYSYHDRFEDGKGTNPEELMAAAHAACFTMKLSFTLNAAGFTADEIKTTCTIGLDKGVIGPSALTVQAKVPNLDREQFMKMAEESKKDCPVSKAYNMDVTLDASLMD